MRFQPGEKAFIIKNNSIVCTVEVIGYQSQRYTVRLEGMKGAIRISKNRLFRTEEKAKRYLTGEKGTEKVEQDSANFSINYKDPFEGKRTNRNPHEYDI